MQVRFPYGFDNRGRTASASYEAHIRHMIEQVLFTTPGERVNRPDFGSGLLQMVFAPASDELATAVQFLVQGSLQRYLGDAIQVEAVDVRTSDSTLEVTVQYVLRLTGQRQVEQFRHEV